MRLLAHLVAAFFIAAASPASALPVDALQSDLALMRTAIEEGHPGARRYLSEQELAAVFDNARAEIAEPMEARQFYSLAASVVGALRDGHTSIDLSEADSEAFRNSAPVLPLRLYLRDGRLFVLRDLSGARRSLAGREIVSINNVSASDLIARLTAATPGDGVIVSAREYRLSRGLRFNRLHALLLGPANVYRVRVRARVGARAVELQGQPLAALEQALDAQFPQDRAEGAPAELSFLTGDVALLTIRSFSGFADTARTQRLGAFLEDAFSQMRAREAKTLIIDVRDNGGGRDELGRVLFQYIAERPFAYYRGLYLQSREFSFSEHADPPVPGPPPNLYEVDSEGRLRWLEHDNYGEHQPAATRFEGPVYILMNGGSFSTTSEFLSIAHANRRATFIGEEAGGGYYGNTSGIVLTVTLPNSGLRLRLPVQRYELAVEGFLPVDRGVPPDHQVTPTIGDLIAGRDEAMETALRLARRRR